MTEIATRESNEIHYFTFAALRLFLSVTRHPHQFHRGIIAHSQLSCTETIVHGTSEYRIARFPFPISRISCGNFSGKYSFPERNREYFLGKCNFHEWKFHRTSRGITREGVNMFSDVFRWKISRNSTNKQIAWDRAINLSDNFALGYYYTGRNCPRSSLLKHQRRW